MKIFSKIVNAGIFAAALAGCTVGPDYTDPSLSLKIPDLKEDKFFHDAGLWKSACPASSLPKGDWWSVFEDSELRTLLEKCKEDNPNLEAAFYRVEQAREAALMDKSELYPSLTGHGSYSITSQSKNAEPYYGQYDTWLAGFGITWDLDLFGRIRSLLKSDVANAQAQLDAYQNLMLLLQADVANTYFQIRQLYSERNLLKRTLDVRKEQTELVRSRVKFDYSSDIDLQRAIQQEAEAAAQLAEVERSLVLSRNYLALLMGTTPSSLVLKDAELGEDLPSLPAAVPSELLERRPDIAAAEREVCAANAKIGAAQAAFFPTVSLTANTDLSAQKIDKLINSSSFAWGISPQIYIPIFEAGRNMAQKRIALAAHAETLENYKWTVLSAIREVEDALANVNHLKIEYERRAAVVKASVSVMNLTQKQYDLGFVDYFSVSDAQSVALANERLLLQLKGARFRACVSLIVGLGGGWSVSEENYRLPSDYGQDDIIPEIAP